MSDLSQFANMAEILGALIVIGGVFFAVVQMRQIRQQRREMAAIELFRFFGRPQFSQAYHRVLRLPEGLNKTQLCQYEDEIENCAMVISTTMENIGVMVYHRIVPSIVVRNLIGTSTIILWTKLHPWIADMRKDLDNPAMFEWFEWLSTVLEKMNEDGQEPAYVAFKRWKPSTSSHDL
ncbi:MAG: hypothetical protein OER97_00455 [Gammaproteobacteria bacterium]|nr:hypothetical protein [Gammaproteobacteria bacterium]